MKQSYSIFNIRSGFLRLARLAVVSMVCLFVISYACASSIIGKEKIFDVIKERICEDIRVTNGGSPEKRDVQINALLSKMQKDGSFAGMDYKNTARTSWPPLEHLGNTMRMCLGYTSKNSRFYQRKDLKDKIEKALAFWHESNPRSNNWWMNQIAAPQKMGQILLIMEEGREKLSPALRGKLLERMKTACGDPRQQTGANKTDVAIHFMYRACLTRDVALMKDSVREIFIPLSYTVKEGIQHDNSYMQHGPQLYIGGYGAVMLDGSIKTASYFAGTEFALSGEKLEILSRFAREAYLPTVRGCFISWNVMGRGMTRERALSQKGLVSKLEKMKKIDGRYAQEYEQAIARIKEEKAPGYGLKPFNRHFYRSDYTLHQRPGYTIDLRMVSTRTARSEQGTGNGEGFKQYFLSDGAMAIQVTGREYEGIFPVWDWSKIPGVTCPALSEIPLANSWVAMGTSRFAGGVSDGQYSASAYQYGDTYKGINTSARKSWFMFDREVVCLGAGITSENDHCVNTTVNQCLLAESRPCVMEKGRPVSIPKGEQVFRASGTWVLHGGVGYYFPKGGNIRMNAGEQQGRWYDINRNYSRDLVKKEVFSLWLDHGVRPKEGSYAYTIVPGVQKPEDLKNYPAGEVVIAANSAAVQAVCHEGLRMLQAVFWEKGELKYKGLSLSVDQPCVVLLKNAGTSQAALSVADPSQTQDRIKVRVSLPGRARAIDLSCDMSGEPHEKGRTKSFPLR